MMAEETKGLVILAGAGLIALTIVAWCVSSYYETVHVEAIKAGLVQDPAGNWVEKK
jgi:hypothetical protein